MKLKKGSAAAKAFMAKIRAAKGKTKKAKVGALKKKAPSKIGFEDKPVQFIDYKDRLIMFEPHYKKYYANDIEFKTLAAAKKYIDKISKISGIKKKKATPKKKAAKKKSSVRNYGSHKDTKSHNVNIRVMSGNLKHDHITLKFYDDLRKEILQREDVIHDVTVNRKADLIRANGKMWFNKWVRDAKNHVKAQKKLLTQLKKSI